MSIYQNIVSFDDSHFHFQSISIKIYVGFGDQIIEVTIEQPMFPQRAISWWVFLVLCYQCVFFFFFDEQSSSVTDNGKCSRAILNDYFLK